MTLRILLGLFVSLPLLLMVTPLALPETGSIDGRISDQFGPVADASITIRNVMSGETNTVISEASGRYHRDDLPRGHYSLRVEAAGHDSAWILRVGVERGFTTHQDIVLRKTP